MVMAMVVNSPLIRPAISWGAGIGGVPLDCHDHGQISWGSLTNILDLGSLNHQRMVFPRYTYHIGLIPYLANG